MFDESFLLYTLKQEDFEQLENITERFSLLFNNTIAFEAQIRRGDAGILERVARRVNANKSNKPVSILEIGAGATYATEVYENAPWLARVISSTYGDKVEMIASDYRTNNLVEMSPKENTPLRKDNQEISLFAENKLVPTIQQTYIRPCIDNEVERALYNLTFKENVDATKLSEYFPKNSFDMVIARHIGQHLFIDDVQEEVEKVLKKEGTFVVTGEFLPFTYVNQTIYKKVS